jgi:two-component system chemotaxis response regulator CheY
MCTVLEGICVDLGISKVEKANRGDIAWDILKKDGSNFDLVLADNTMPGLTGLELLDKIRKNERLARTRVILITSESERDVLLEALDLKVDGFVTKPFLADNVKSKILHVLNIRA